MHEISPFFREARFPLPPLFFHRLRFGKMHRDFLKKKKSASQYLHAVRYFLCLFPGGVRKKYRKLGGRLDRKKGSPPWLGPPAGRRNEEINLRRDRKVVLAHQPYYYTWPNVAAIRAGRIADLMDGWMDGWWSRPQNFVHSSRRGRGRRGRKTQVAALAVRR